MKSNISFIKSYLKKLPLGSLVLLALFASSIFIFTYVAHQVFWEKEEEMDQEIFNYIAAYIMSPGLTGFMETVTYFASAGFLRVAYAILVLLYLLRKNFKRAIEIGVIGLGGYAINYFMKISFQRTRPDGPLIEPLLNFSFPSGHATSGFIFYGLLIYLIWKTGLSNKIKYPVSILLACFALLIGFSRIYLRMHYPSDVFAGFCIGFAWLSLSTYLMSRLKEKSDRETTSREKVEK